MTHPTVTSSDGLHAVDAATGLLDAHDEGRYQGATHEAWGNMVGPFGGITAAAALAGVMKHPQRLGTPISLTVNYATAVAPGAFHLTAVPVRTNRSTQHWTLQISQPDAAGQDGVVLTGTAVTAARRETWSTDDIARPKAPAPTAVPRLRVQGVEWVNRYDMHIVRGSIPGEWNGQGDDSLTQMWVRDDPPRPLDFLSLAALSDVFFPRAWLRRATRVPAGTVTMTIYFHAGEDMLARTGTGYLFAQAQAQSFRNGFFDQTGQLWNEAGELLVTTHQLVYYKE